MHAEIIAVGTELVSGQKLDTNSQWLSQQLANLGISTHYHTTLGDDLAENVAALRIAITRAGLVLITGGLGPTLDDLTRESLAEAVGVGLVEDPGSLEEIADLFARRNREMPARNRVQALRPEGSEPISNLVGTAPGIWMKVGSTFVACLPGVPSEMKIMFSAGVVRRLGAAGIGGRVITHRVINMFGKGESEIEALALDLTARGRVPEVGITASDATISFRITGEGTTTEEAIRSTDATAMIVYERFSELIVGEGTDDVAHGLVAELRKSGATIAVAESCTGGMIADRLTRIPGVSDVFLGGVVSYANSAKVNLLGVPQSLIDTNGAVTAEVAESMARGALERFGATIAISSTGIAGPDGGTASKPIGLVYLGLATATTATSKRIEIGPEQPRDIIRSRASKQALNFARLHLLAPRRPRD